MIDLDALLTDILKSVEAHAKCSVILADQGGKKPSGSYAVLKLMSSGSSEVHPLTNAYIDPENELDMVEEQITFPVVNLSITTVGSESFSLAQSVQSWFKNPRHYENTLATYSGVIRNVTSISNRDALLGRVKYERKQGFDVQLQVRSVETTTLPRIVAVETDEGEY